MSAGERTRVERMPDRAGYVVGVAFVVVGGLVAAVAGPLQFDKGSWLAAYAVLVCGVGQCLASRQAGFLHAAARSHWMPPARLAAWNAGNLLVIAGALASVPIVADVGGAVLLFALILALIETRGSARHAPALVVRVVYVVFAVSIPVGLVITHLRG